MHACALLVSNCCVQGKRNRGAPARFETHQAADRKAEDAHNQQKHNNQYARADLVEAVTERVFGLRVHQMIERWWRDEELQIPTGLKAHNDVRKKKEARKKRNEPLAAKCVAAKDAIIDKWHAAADKAISELSCRQKKDLALIKFASVFEETRSKTQAYQSAADEPSIRVTAQTVSTWMADYEANDGFFSDSMWGKHGSVPWLLADEDIQAECRGWIQKHSPKKGTPNFTALDFKHFLIDDSRLNPPTTGYLNSPGPAPIVTKIRLCPKGYY